MKPTDTSRPAQPQTPRRPLLLAGAFFLLGVALTGIWFHHHQAGSAAGELSAPTKNLLGQLEAPVTIRYYALLPGSTDETLQAFAGRVAQLLNAVQAASGGKVQIASFDTPAETNTAAASADGIQAFNLDKGDACFLGLAIASGKNKESFARLQPEWEPALEYDLARAILRVAATAAPARPAPEIAKPSPEIIASINRLIPDVNATSVEAADQIFHAEFMKQCAEAGTEMETQINAAQQQVVQAQTGGSPADLEAAQKNLLQVQLAQADKLKQVAARLQIQLAVFQRMNAGATNDAK
ncbi:MAG TPA: Gldg family protein [Candidatus Limnocylindrales bacterium]|nr:Gldg family protein [Candidatus Limnocylindrales bacterium]